jgi:6-phosphogluconate dehydrogenase (decarboxylating)
MMVPAAVVEQTVADLSHCFERGDIIIDGGNSHCIDDICGAKYWQRTVFTTWMRARVAASGGSGADSAR